MIVNITNDINEKLKNITKNMKKYLNLRKTLLQMQ